MSTPASSAEFVSPSFALDHGSEVQMKRVTGSDGDYFAPSTAPFMINYRVADLPALLMALGAEARDGFPGAASSGKIRAPSGR
jgi:hypothetical protein